MKIKVQYNSEQERAEIIAANSDKFLIEEQNITEGNFLIFSDTLPEPPIVHISVPQEDFEQLKSQNAEIILTLVMNDLM